MTENPFGDQPPRGRERSWQRRALIYFGLAAGDGESRYGPGVKPDLDADVDDLSARVAALERELRRHGGP
ncbi:MAG: hypothetical protein QOE11_1663 [Solirubrobacteraceae bacterium]|jgi:hypothetical protein|nr:hypothetical protein [Solirubrobacteraceae bacterium]